MFDLLACASFAIEVGQEVAHENRVEFVFDCIYYLLSFVGVAGQLGHHRVKVFEYSEIAVGGTY